MGQWVVQERAGAFFSAVAPDMKLEQTTQCSAKGPGGYYVVGNLRNAGCIAEFELLFHEVVAISNLLRQVTNAKLIDHTECRVQHSLYGSKGMLFDKNVARLLDFVKSRENPFIVTSQVPLHNFITKQAVDGTVTVY